jgi:hypothetical protein
MWPKYGVFHTLSTRLTPLNCLRRWRWQGRTVTVLASEASGQRGNSVRARIARRKT